MHAQFERYRAMVEAALPLALPKDGGWAEVITDAARYSLLAGGQAPAPVPGAGRGRARGHGPARLPIRFAGGAAAAAPWR